jgi:hypothetical protein
MVPTMTAAMWDVLCYATEANPVYAKKPFTRPARALQRYGFFVIWPNNVIQVTDAGRAALTRQRRRALQGKKVSASSWPIFG